MPQGGGKSAEEEKLPLGEKRITLHTIRSRYIH